MTILIVQLVRSQRLVPKGTSYQRTGGYTSPPLIKHAFCEIICTAVTANQDVVVTATAASGRGYSDRCAQVNTRSEVPGLDPSNR